MQSKHERPPRNKRDLVDSREKEGETALSVLSYVMLFWYTFDDEKHLFLLVTFKHLFLQDDEENAYEHRILAHSRVQITFSGSGL